MKLKFNIYMLESLLKNSAIVFNEDTGRLGGYTQGDYALYQDKGYWAFEQVKMRMEQLVLTINNAPYSANPNIQFLERLMYTKETYNGGIEEFTFNFNIFQRNGTFIQPDATKISRWTWNFTMEEYAAKPIDFSFLDARQAKKNGGSIAKEFELKLTSLLNAYRDIFIPNMIKYTLFNVPLAGGEYQTQSVPTIGLLRNTTVIPERLQLADTTGTVTAGQPHSVIRNHYRAITNPSTGVTPKDIVKMKNYLKEYVDNENVPVYCLASPSFMTSLRDNAYTYAKNVDMKMERGLEVLMIEGVRVIPYEDYIIPDGYAIFIAGTQGQAEGNAEQALLYKMVHALPEYRGIKLVIGNEYFYWDNLKESEVKDMKLEIQDIGMFLVGRHRAIIVDGNDGRPAQISPNIMTQVGIDELQAFAWRCRDRYVQ